MQRPNKLFNRTAERTSSSNDNEIENVQSAATFGHYCRSNSFISMTQESWMEAIQTTPGQWTLKMMHCDLQLNSDQDGVTRQAVDNIPLGESLPLMDVLQKMYEFESSYPMDNDNVTILENEDSLGIKHYIAFGKREAIGFDANGKPLLTAQGHILEYTQISYDDIIAVQEAWAKKQNIFMPEADDMLPQFPTALDMEDLDTLMIIMENHNFITKLKHAFEQAIKKFDRLVEVTNNVEGALSDFIFATNTVQKLIESHFELISMDELDSENQHQLNEVRGKLNQYVISLELHGRLQAAKKAFSESFYNGGKATETRAKILQDAKQIKDIYIKLGNEPVDVKEIAADIIRANRPYGHVLEIRPKAFRLILQTMEDMVDRSKILKESLRKEALTAAKNKPAVTDKTKRQPLGSHIVDMMSLRSTNPRKFI